MTKIEIIKTSIRAEKILNAETFQSSDIEAVLARRSDKPFEGDWLRIFETQKNAQFSPEQRQGIDRVRELAFKAAYAFTLDSDLAGYVSDDFELIAKGVELGMDDLWLNGLLQRYLSKEIPTGGLDIASQTPICDAVGQLADDSD